MKHFRSRQGLVESQEHVHARRRRRGGGWGAALAAAGTLVLAGCGGGAQAAHDGKASSAAGATPVVSANGVTLESQGATGAKTNAGHPRTAVAGTSATATSAPKRAHAGTRSHAGAPPKISHGNPVRRPAPGTGGKSINDDNPAGKASAADSGKIGPANPCLVSRGQAESFTGTAVAQPKVAPLGPTCVYLAKGGKMVTVAVERTVFAKLKPHMRNLVSYTVRGTQAYCGIYGAPVTYVLLSRERALVVSAPCDVGKRFATAALAKLSA